MKTTVAATVKPTTMSVDAPSHYAVTDQTRTFAKNLCTIGSLAAALCAIGGSVESSVGMACRSVNA